MNRNYESLYKDRDYAQYTQNTNYSRNKPDQIQDQKSRTLENANDINQSFRYTSSNNVDTNKFQKSFHMLEDLKKLLGVRNDNMLQREIEELLIFRKENSKKIDVYRIFNLARG